MLGLLVSVRLYLSDAGDLLQVASAGQLRQQGARIVGLELRLLFRAERCQQRAQRLERRLVPDRPRKG